MFFARNVSRPRHAWSMRPAIKAGLRPLWRDKDTVQIGVDPRRARALTGLGKAAAMVSLLDGSRDTAEVVRTAAAYGIRQEAAHRVVGLLASAGVLDDFPASLRAALPDYLRARIGPELACAALAYGTATAGRRCSPGGGGRSPGCTARAGWGPASRRSSPPPGWPG